MSTIYVHFEIWVQKIEPQWHEKRKCIYYSLQIMLYNSQPECASIQKTIYLLALLNTECRQWNLGVWKKMKNANNWGKKHLKLKKTLERIELGKQLSHERALKSNCDLSAGIVATLGRSSEMSHWKWDECRRWVSVHLWMRYEGEVQSVVGSWDAWGSLINP